MPLYHVGIREVHVSHREVEADTPEEAMSLAEEDLDTEFQLEYSYTMVRPTWTVKEVNNGNISRDVEEPAEEDSQGPD